MPIKKYVYSNCIRYKLHNRRVTIIPDIKENLTGIQFELLTDNLSPKFHHQIIKDKIVVTSFSLTIEAIAALCDGLGEILTKKGFNNIKDVNNHFKDI